MLLSVQARDFSLLRDVSVRLGPGLTVLTGDSGAGKSLLFDAVAFALGGRPHRSLLAEGASACEVTLEIELSAKEAKRAGVPWCEGKNTLSRRLSDAGRSRLSINGQNATLVELQRGTERVIEITGQFESRMLFDQARHIELLDAFGDDKLAIASQHYAALYDEYRQLVARLRTLREAAGNRGQEIDFLQYQVEELGKAAVQPGERAETEAALRLLENAGQLIESSTAAANALSGDEADSAYDRAALAAREIDRLAEILGEDSQASEDPQELQQQSAQALEQLQDLAHRLNAFAASIQHDPQELQRRRERLDEILRLERKYALAADELAGLLAERQQRLDFLLDESQSPEALEAELERQTAVLQHAGGQLTKLREAAAKRLEKTARGYFSRLEFPHVELAVEIEPAEPGPQGLDRAELLVSLNPGEPARPLALVASGGEASRLLLALKAALSERIGFSTMLLDEIEAGLGGQTAQRVAEVLSALAGERQIIAITHLPVVAVQGASHLLAAKRVEAGRSSVRITPISGEERRQELARMVGGGELDKVLQLVDSMLAGR